MKKKVYLLLILCITLLVVLAPTSAFAGPSAELTNKISASDGSAFKEFGKSVAINDDWIVIGSWNDNANGGWSGSAFVYNRTTGAETKLLASDGAFKDYFGNSVAISGDTVVVGAYCDDDKGADSGSVYVFDASTGTQIRKLTASDGAAEDNFGVSVAISGNKIVVGATGDDDKGSFSGSVYVFDASTGLQTAKIIAGDGLVYDFLGCSVAISGDIIVAGAEGDDDRGLQSGSAYIFNATTGAQVAHLLASDGAASDGFGASVAISGNTILIGSYGDDDNGSSSGAAYVFNATTGTQTRKLTASDGIAHDNLGCSVAISGDMAIVGARYDDDNGGDAGSIYVFDASTGTQTGEFVASDGEAGDSFGNAVAISGNTVLVGAFYDDTGTGSAYYADLYNVTVSAGTNGTVSPSGVQTVLYDDNLTITPSPDINYEVASVTSYQGYTVTDNLDGTYTIENIQADDTITIAFTPAPHDVNVVADANGSVSPSGVQTVTHDGDLIITPSPNTGYLFGGFVSTQGYTINDNLDGTYTVKNIQADGTITVGFVPISYSVTFNGNGSDSGSMTDQGFDYDEEKALTANAFLRTGFTFAGWALTSGGAAVYADSAPVSNLTDADGDTVELFATWTQDIYTVTYDNNGGLGSIISQTGVYDDVITLDNGANFTKASAVLEEWTIGSLGGLYTLTGSVTATAVWATDTDEDGISDDDEIAAGTDPNDARDVPRNGTIAGVIVDLAGNPVSGMTVVLNSTPRTTTTNANGEFVFSSVPFASHTLSLRQGTTEVASYTLNFVGGTKAGVVINDNGASSATTGQVTTTVTNRLLSLNLNIQLNAGGFWQLGSANIFQRAIVDNPETGDATEVKLYDWMK